MSALSLLYSRRSKLRSALRHAVRVVRNPYAPLFRAAGKDVLIDSSKNPGWFRRQTTPGHPWRNVTPYLIYMGRDGRAVANSYLRKYPERGIARIAEE